MNRADSLFAYDPGASLALLESALSDALRSRDKNLESDCYVVIAKVNNHLGQYDIAVRNLRRAQALRSASPAPTRSSRNQPAEDAAEADEVSISSYSNSRGFVRAKYSPFKIQKLLALTLRRQGLYREAIQEFETYASLASSYGDTLELIATWNLIGDTYLNLNLPDEAQRYYERSAQYSGTDFLPEQVKANIGIGNAESQRGNYEGAEFKYTAAEESLDKIQADTAYTSLNSRIAEGYSQVGRTDREIELRRRNVNDLENRPESYGRLIDEEVLLANSYLEEGNTSNAFDLLMRAKRRAELAHNLEQVAQALKGLTKYYEAQGEVSMALDAYRSYVEINDSIEEMESSRLKAQIAGANTINQQLLRLESLESEMRVSEQQIQILEQDRELQAGSIRQQNLLILFLTIGLLIVSVAIVWIIVESRKRNRANQMLALKSLRSQMNPHFIFNALNSINGFISRKQEKEANKYLAEFSKLMRSVLEDSQEDFLTLREEIDNLERYTKLEHSRFQDKFEYQIKVDDSIDRDQWSVPPMLLQPYVENAVWHGLRYLEEPGRLVIQMEEREDHLRVIIEDNGVGRKRSEELKTRNQKKNKSTGIKNTSERLKLLNSLYKTNYRIDVEDSEPHSENTGTKVMIRIPKRQNHE